MATSTFTKKIVLYKEAAEILADDLSKDEKTIQPVVTNYILDDKEFMEKCLGLSDCNK